MRYTVLESRRRDLGGFEVRRVLPAGRRRMVGPFIFFDHMGPVEFQPGLSRSADVRPHPHIGLATVTWLFDGEIMHRDSVGSAQAIRPGEVNWMTAGRGITHSERFERARREGGRMNGIQAWVALPEDQEECEPSFSHHAELPSWAGDGVAATLVAGQAEGRRSPVPTLSPLVYLEVRMHRGSRFELPPAQPERAAYIVSGAVECNGNRHGEGSMLIFEPGAVVLSALEDSLLMVLGGEPLGERFLEWNFVSSSRERIEQAKADWRAGRMKLPDLDREEWIPLPEDAEPAPNPMS